MIVDANVHLSPFLHNGAMRAEELLRDMASAGVDRAVCAIALPEQDEQLLPSLQYLYEVSKSSRGRIVGMGYLDPRAGVDRAVKLARRCMDDYGFAGVRVDARHARVRLDDERRMYPICSELERCGIPLAVYVGSDAFDLTHPFRLEKLARRFEGLRILAMHMGGAHRPDYVEACVDVASRLCNVMLVGGAVTWNGITTAIQRTGADKLCFGSGVPVHSFIPASVAGYRAILAREALSVADQERIFSGNISRFLLI